MTEEGRTVGLMSLPLEIRDQILQEAISHPRPAPRSPSTCMKDWYEWDHSFQYTRKIFVEKSDPGLGRDQNLTAASLRLTSRQLRAETQYLVNRVEPELDVMFLNSCGIFATWLCRPFPRAKVVDKLRVRVRAFDAPFDDMDPMFRARDTMARIGGEGVALETHLDIASLLSQYLAHACSGVNPRDGGPGQRWEVPMKAAPATAILLNCVTIRSVVIDVEAPDMDPRPRVDDRGDAFGNIVFGGSDEWPSFVQRPSGAENARYGPAHKLAVFIVDILRWTLASFVTTRASYMVMAVGKYEIRVNGAHLERIDVGQYYKEARAAALRKVGDGPTPPDVTWLLQTGEKRRLGGI
ncbi:uncharacterized protein DNG_07476 [Cephalotrichum gorgonifer]|uniref:Uncharacterized protein n=1 Tax=Cephalotrichum gorgonifer TaxID=2041049 RepID=A0AAE8N1N2_9PEZI|nr:uncharacterized protein DNG_07476 [Cephalotrichum gorgonifer]